MKKNVSPVMKLTMTALLSAMAVVLGLWRFPVFPTASFLTVDFADVPILLATLLFGPAAGAGGLFCVCAIQAFLLGGDGLIGFVMHMVASGAMIFAVWAVCGKKRGGVRLAVALVVGVLTRALVMIPLNYLLTPLYTGAPREAITQLLLPVLIPFNLIAAGSNCLAAGLLYGMLTPVLRQYGLAENAAQPTTRPAAGTADKKTE